MEGYNINKKDEVQKAKVRELVNTITFERERASNEIIEALCNLDFELEIERVQTSNWDGKVIIKVYGVRK